MKEFCDGMIRDFKRLYPGSRTMCRCSNMDWGTSSDNLWPNENPYIKKTCSPFEIEKVIFNDPATIVIWKDGTKTVVKTQNGETFDPEKGLAMAIAKKTFGNKGNYFNHISKWVDKYEEQKRLDKMLEDSLITTEMAAAAFNEAAERIKKLGERLAKLE